MKIDITWELTTIHFTLSISIKISVRFCCISVIIITYGHCTKDLLILGSICYVCPFASSAENLFCSNTVQKSPTKCQMLMQEITLKYYSLKYMNKNKFLLNIEKTEKGTMFHLPQFVDDSLNRTQHHSSVVMLSDVKAPAETTDQPQHGRNSCHQLGCGHGL